MKTIKLFFLILIPILFTNCKKEFTIEYVIANKSDRSIEVIIQKSDESPIDTNLISSFASFIFIVEMGEGETTKTRMEELEQIPLHLLNIQDINGKQLRCDEMKIDCWSQSRGSDNEGVGEIRIRLVNGSFT